MTPIKIKFGTDGWRAIIAQEYTTDNVARVTRATAEWVKNMAKEEGKEASVVIGYDCRFAGKLFGETSARVFCANGVKVHLADAFVSTPMVSMGAMETGSQAGIVITASHNPPSYNGYKLKSGYGGPTIPEEIAKVESIIPEYEPIPSKSAEDYRKEGMIVSVDLEGMYLKAVRSSFDLEKIRASGKVLAFDAMYGAGQRVVPELLPETILLHCEDNPGFMGRAPEPIHRNLQELSALIAGDDKIDLGLANDGDADRIGMYNGKGEFIDSHHIILLLIHYLHKYKGMDGKVVIAFSVSGKVKKLCDHYGIPYEVTKIGFKYICGKMVTDDVLLGGEESGGIAVKGHIPERDGVWCGLLLLEFMAMTGKSFDELIQEVYDIVGPFSFNRNDLHLDEATKLKIVDNCESGKYTSFGDYSVQSTETIDGFKYHLDDDRWIMIRPSGTEPVLRVYAEAPSAEEVEVILKAAKATLLA
ncbi:MAG: phosphomannomutase [Limisphaerales bacterium]|jgi:phosphomannomutase